MQIEVVETILNKAQLQASKQQLEQALFEASYSWSLHSTERQDYNFCAWDTY